MRWWTRWWKCWQRITAPAIDLPLAPTRLAPRAEAREAVSDVDREYRQYQTYLTRKAMDKLCAQANAYVVRSYGVEGEREVLTNRAAPTLTTDEGKLLEKIDVTTQ